LVSDFEKRRQEIKRSLLSTFDEISAHSTGDDDMTELKDKAKALFRALEQTSTRAGFNMVETGILSLQLDLSRARADYHRSRKEESDPRRADRIHA
jgi:hypothetical protein